MANNIKGGAPNAVVAKTTVSFATAGITALNTEIIYLVDDPLKSYVPGRAINGISGFEANKGYYMVAKIDMDLGSILVPPVSTQLATPSSFTATAVSNAQINLSWAAVPSATGYVVDRATNSAFTTGVTLAIYSGSGTSYNNTGLSPLTTYYYRVRATAIGFTNSAYATANASTLSSSYDTDAQAFFTAASITDTTQKDAVNQLVLDFKAAGIWNRMVAIYPFVGGTASTHKWNLKDPRDLDVAKRLTFTGGWVHSANGALPDGSTGYANTFINLNQDVPQYSMHGSYYSRTNTAPGSGDYFLFGMDEGGPGIGLDIFNVSGYYAVVADTTKTITVPGQSEFTKLLGISCYHFDNFRIYRDGSVLGSNSGTRINYFPPINPTNPSRVYLGAYNNNGTPIYFSSRQCAFASFGYGLDPTQWAALNTAVTNFQTTIGRVIP